MFEEIFNHSPVAMILINEQGNIKLANRHAEELFEYSKGELLGKDISILVPKDVRPKHPELVQKYFKSPLPRQMGVGRDLFGVKKDKTNFPVEVGLNPIESDGELFVMSYVIDITERHKAEERFKAAVEAAPNGMIMINQYGKIVLINKKTEEIFGYARDELINRPIEILVPEDFRAPHPRFVKSYIEDPEPRSMGIGRELFGRHKNGKLVPVEIGLQPIYADDEIFVISSVVDISQRKVAEKEIFQKTEEIKEFSYRTSHDLRSPLLTMGGLIDFVLEDIKNGNMDRALEGGLKVKSLNTKVNTLIEDIMILTKTDLVDEEESEFNFDEYLVNFKERYAKSIEDNKVKIETSFLHKKKLITQKTRLLQVLDNLISNSIKYSNSLIENKFVRLQTFSGPDRFFIQIEDNGIGIPKEKHDLVFSMFKRFHDGTIEGSGLGLYMVRKHINKLEAKITFESSPKGTVFYIEFEI